MNDKPNHLRDRFRVGLTALLTLLIGGGMVLEFTTAQALSATASPAATLTQSASQSATKTETVTEAPTVPATPDPALEAIKAHQAASGCNFDIDSAATVKTVGTCKILLIGDSIGNNLGYGMLGQISGAKTLSFALRAKASTGLSNSWYYNWESKLKTFLRNEKPNLVIVLMGANDRQNIKIGSTVYTYGTAAWKRVYSQSVGRMTKLATDSGAYVMWFGMPICKPYNYNKGMTLITSLYKAQVPKNTGARFIDLHELTADAHGNYTQYLTVNGYRKMVRGEDGIHFTSPGQGVLGTYAIDQVATLLHVKLKSSSPRVVTK